MRVPSQDGNEPIPVGFVERDDPDDDAIVIGEPLHLLDDLVDVLRSDRIVGIELAARNRSDPHV